MRALAVALAVLAGTAAGHEVRPAYLEVREIVPDTYDLLWKVPARGEGERLALYVRLPEDCALLAPPQASFVAGAYLERSRIVRPGGLTGAEIVVEGLSATLTDALARVERSDGSTQVERLTPDRPSFVVEAAPRPFEVAWTYLALGVEHILFGVDHLLFVLGLLLLVRRWRHLVGTITAFTVAHSVTLTAATLGFVRVPGPPVEAAIALSIAFVASEILHRRRGSPSLAERRPWVVSFSFGLLHGFGFAGALHEVGLPQSAIPLALAFFNLGVEAGQLLFIAGVVTLLAVARQASRVLGGRPATILPGACETASAYAIGGLAAFWLLERTSRFIS
jgi:hydrogenase/urease accessory protein HupE